MNLHHHTLLSGLLLLTFSLSGHAFDLMQAWQSARQFNADFSAARADRDAGREKAVQGRAQLLPALSASANYAYNKPLEPAGQSRYDSTSYGLNLQQALFDIGKYSAYQQGKTATQQAEIRFQASEQQLILDTAQAYFNVLKAQDTLAATRAKKKTFLQQLAQAKAAFEIGTATITDTHEAQAGFDGAVAEEINALNDLELAENDLARISGLETKGIQAVQDQLPLAPPQPTSLAAWLDIAMQHSLDIQLAEQTLTLAKQTLTEKKGNHLPVVSLSAGYNDNSTRAPNQPTQSRGSSIGVGVSLPLFSGGGIDSQVREAAAQEMAAKDRLEASKRQVRENVRRTFLGVTNGAALVRAQQQLLLSARSQVESTRLGKDVGIRTNIDLLQAEQSYYNTLTSLANAKYSYLTARLALHQAAGKLDETVLAEVNTLIRR
ncbi:TolC family outer membrane protein [Neisseriaceae bacterium TC5R-5]|nr:TolC family outer membrane protein [Neisseriaceae bacterium TC5R-5]